MLSWFQVGQLAFAAFLIVVISERVFALYVRLATSDDAARWLARELEAKSPDGPRAWARARPEAQLARIVELALDDARRDELGELFVDVRAETLARLSMLRVSATIASTLGLLGGIVTLARGAPEAAGLLALQAGGLQRLAMNEAISTMAIGVATSAFCFHALALLRTAAEKRLTQARQLARAAGCLPLA